MQKQYVSVMWPHSQDATLSNVATKTRNLPLVRWKLALHVHPVVIYDSWRCVDHLWWLLKENILFVLFSSLWYCMWLVRYSSSQVHISDTMTGVQHSSCYLLVICDDVVHLPPATLQAFSLMYLATHFSCRALSSLFRGHFAFPARFDTLI